MKRCTIILLAAAFLVAVPFAASAETIVFPTVRSVSAPFSILVAATTGTSDIVELHHELAYTSIWVLWNGACTAGVVQVQAAMTTPGPWITVATLTNKTNLPDWVLLVGSPGALRVTVTTPVVGGTISAYLTGKR